MSKFNRQLNKLDVFSIALGAIIGWGCFVLPGNSFLPKAGPLGAVIGLLIGAVLVSVISSSYGYLIVKFPVSGGEFEYVMSEMGPTHAFICGWSLILTYISVIPMNATAIALISKYLFNDIAMFGKLYTVAGWDVYISEVLIAVFFIAVLGFVNIKGIKSSVMIQTAVAIGLMGIILLVTAMVMFSGVDFGNLKPYYQSENTSDIIKGIFAIVAMSPWAYVGFDCIPQMAEEYNFSMKKSQILIIISILSAAFCYISINTITAIAMPWQELLAEKPFWATGAAIEMTVGKIGLYLIGIAMFCAVIGGINAFYMSSSRLMAAMAEKKVLPEKLGVISEKNKTPVNAIIIIALISIIAPWFGREVLSWIVDMTSTGTSLVFMYTTYVAYKIAKRTDNNLQKILSIIGFIFSGIFLALLLIPNLPSSLTIQSLVALVVWIVIGVAVYFKNKSNILSIKR